MDTGDNDNWWTQVTIRLNDEAFHFPVQEFIQRWAVPENITSGLVGEPGEGTTIDVDEPFLLR